MLSKKLQLIKEDIYGNIATVYHRCQSLEKLKDILNKTYSNQTHIHFNSYRSSLYTTYDMKSQTNENGNLNDMEGIYGGIVIKFGVKGLRNFLFTSYDEYRKIDPQAAPQNYAERQVQRLLMQTPANDYTGGQFRKLIRRDGTWLLGELIELIGPSDGLNSVSVEIIHSRWWEK